jgi:drug/metabolite transporter (DMT)-like permease
MTAERRATLWLLGSTVLWGSSFFTMAWGTRGLAGAVGKEAAPAAFLFLRFAAALAMQAALFPKSALGIDRATLGAGTLLALPFYAGFLLQVTGLGETSSTVSAFLTSLMVAITPLLGRLFFGERPGWPVLAGGLVSLGGVWVLTDPAGGTFGRGEVLTLACAVAFSLQIQLTNVVTRKHPPEGISLVMFGCATLFSGLLLAARGVAPADLARGLGERHVAWTVLWTAGACSVAAMWALNRFQRDIAPTRAAVLYTVEPVFAALFAAGLDGEPITVRKAAGGAIILGGNLLCELLARRRS